MTDQAPERAVCGLGTCERPAVARVLMTYLRRLPPEGVTSKEQVLCGPCWVDKTAEFKDIGGEVRAVEWIGQPPAE